MFPEAGGGIEFLIVAAIALIVVGPKELPTLLRKLGQFIGKMRRIAADFRTSFDEMAKQSELDDLRKQVEEMRSQANAATSDPMGLNSTMSEFNAGMDPEFNYGVIPEEYQAPESAPIVEDAKPARKRAAAKPKAEVKPATARKTPAKAATKPAGKASTTKAPAKKRAAPKIVT